MVNIRLYSLGELSWKDTQLFYHAMAHLGVEGVIICRPSGPYYCIGFHQDVGQELDVRFLQAIGTPFFRRETGGGTVRLDKGQVFYQIIVRRDSKDCPPNPDRFYERYLQPAVEALASLGLGAIVAEPNDILVNGRKISGNGGGEVGECKVLVGDILVDFDPSKVCRGLKGPSVHFREACLRRMRADVTTVKAEKHGTTIDKVEKALKRAYLKVCNDGEKNELPSEVVSKAKELGKKYLSKEWLFFQAPRRPWRRVKIREGVHVAAIPMGDGGEVFGHLFLETAEGRIDRAEIVPHGPSGGEKVDFMWKALIEKGGKHRKDLEKLLLDMDLPKEKLDEAVYSILEKAVGRSRPPTY